MRFDVQDCLRIAIEPAIGLLPSKMDSTAARAMLIAIALQESDLQHRRQRNGPAKSYWQFEVVGVEGVLTHPQSAALARTLTHRLDYAVAPAVIHQAIEDNDCLAAIFARLLLWTVPEPLPTPSDTHGAWQQYLSAWRPGRPHHDRWHARYREAWGALS